MEKVSFTYMLKYFIAFFAGAMLLSVFSFSQKEMLGLPFSLAPISFVIPVLFGGISGLAVSIFYFRLRTSQKRMKDFVNNVDDIVQILDKEGNFIFVNKTWHKTFEYSALEIKELKVFDLLDPAHLEQCKTFFKEFFTHGTTGKKYNTVFRSKSGKRVYLEGNTNCRHEKGEIISTRTIFRDLSERHKANEFQRIAASIFENTKEGVAITDEKKIITYANNAFNKITGYTNNEAMGKNIHKLLRGENQHQVNPEKRRNLLKEKKYWHGDIWAKKKNGEEYPLQITINAIRSPSNETTNYACVFSDISKRKENEMHMHYLATHDTLTDLPNREMFYKHANESILETKKQNQKFAVLFLDLDGFKYINDQYGHHIGDDLLKIIAQRLHNRTRQEDIIARFGGDEFAVLLNNINSLESAKVRAEHILEILATPYHIGEISVQITASIGISLYRKDADIVSLLVEADKAMYKAKKLGKNRVYFIER